MATVTPFVFTLFFFLIAGGIVGFAKGQAPGQGTWCVAKPSASDEELQNNIDYACAHVNCDMIQPGAPCYDEKKLINKASFAMNSYFQIAGRHDWNCDFKKSAIIAITDPSSDACKYESGQ